MIRLGYALTYIPIILMIILMFNPGAYLQNLGILTVAVWVFLFFTSRYGSRIVKREEAARIRSKNNGQN